MRAGNVTWDIIVGSQQSRYIARATLQNETTYILRYFGINCGHAEKLNSSFKICCIGLCLKFHAGFISINSKTEVQSFCTR